MDPFTSLKRRIGVYFRIGTQSLTDLKLRSLNCLLTTPLGLGTLCVTYIPWYLKLTMRFISTTFSSYELAPSRINALQQTYTIPYAIRSLVSTITAKGITEKSILCM